MTRRLTITLDVPRAQVTPLILDVSEAARRRGAQIVKPVEDEPATTENQEQEKENDN